MLKNGLPLALLALASLTTQGNTNEREWRFRVFLDDKEIGYHDFRLREGDGWRTIETEANFEYRLLFIKLYEYEHENTEIWQGDCLSRIQSHTDANGQPYEVYGEQAEDRFVLSSGTDAAELPACVMSFAYWNPRFLEQDRLLNSQNGEFVDVEVGEPEQVEISVRGSVQPAIRYRLEAEELGIELYYSENDEWLALEADAAGGRKLRYELI